MLLGFVFGIVRRTHINVRTFKKLKPGLDRFTEKKPTYALQNPDMDASYGP